MLMNRFTFPLLAAAILVLALAAGCGKDERQEGAGSFAAAAASPGAESTGVGAIPPDQPESSPAERDVQPAASLPPAAASAPSTASPSADAPAAVPSAQDSPAAAGSPAASPSPSSTADPSPPALPAGNAATASPAAAVASSTGVKDGGSGEIHWSEFFDNDLQTTPSGKFWDMSGQRVTINGYMGEVLSFERNWFLLIPAPGAECPFDNGDETYWNKIMMIFTDKGEKLRYTGGPLKVSGRLDVGIKVDESGYKTMFRLYDAKFEKLTE